MLTVRIIAAADNSVVAELDWVSAGASHVLLDEAGWEVIAVGNDTLVTAIEARTAAWWMVMIDHSTGHVHGGPIRSIRVRGGTSTGSTIKFAGGNSNWYMNTSLTLPVPTQTNYPGQTTPRAERIYQLLPAVPGIGDTHASEAVYTLVDEQLNDSLAAYRNREVSLTAASAITVGLQLTGYFSEPFEPLLSTIRRWSVAGGIVTDFQLNGATSEAEMLTRLPNVLAARLSLQDGVNIEWVYEQIADELNYAWVGGSGKGVDRQVAAVANQTSSYGVNPVLPPLWGVPIERFVNASSAQTDEELINAGQLAIEKNLERYGITDVKIQGAGLEFGSDYLLGDAISVVVAGIEYWQLITETHIEWGRNGKVETIKTGIPEGFDDTLLYQPLAPFEKVDLGRQTPPAPLAPVLSAGTLTLVSDTGSTLAFEHVIPYAPGEETGGFRTTHSLESSVDGGAWVDVNPGEFFTHAGTQGEYFLTVTEFETSIPSSTTSLEYRSKLSHPNYPTVYSTIVVYTGTPTTSGLLINDAGDAMLTTDAGDALLTDD